MCLYVTLLSVVAIVLATLPVIMLDMMSGRMTSLSILIRTSPGKPKYCLSRLDRDAYSLTTRPKLIPNETQTIVLEKWTGQKDTVFESLVMLPGRIRYVEAALMIGSATSNL